MVVRSGQQFLDSLRAGTRHVWLEGERVADVTAHPRLAGAARSLAEVFDNRHTFSDDCITVDPDSGEKIAVSHLRPRSRDDLFRRREALTRCAETTAGLMGRTPDYLNVTYAGFSAERDVWAGPGGENERGAANLVAYQAEMARRDLCLTHTIVHPTTDRATDDDPAVSDVALRKVGETVDSIVVSGARILATLAPFAEELAVYPAAPIMPRDDGIDRSVYALSFGIPMDTPGLLFLCRDSVAAPTTSTDRFDRPLSTRFDEQDAFVIFDEVEVPRERVHIDGSIGTYNTVLRSHWWPNIMQQTTVRAHTKLSFAYGLASRMAELVNDRSPHTLDLLGELATYVETTRTALLLAEEHAVENEAGFWFPHERPLHPMRSLLSAWFTRAHDILMTVGSHNLLAAPSRAMLDDVELRPLVDRYLRGAHDAPAEERAAVYRLAWDFVGSGLGARSELYERNYLRSRRSNQMAYHDVYADRSLPDQLVDHFIER